MIEAADLTTGKLLWSYRLGETASDEDVKKLNRYVSCPPPLVTAATLVSENKVLAYPASGDSITTSGNNEEYVSMGLTAAIKLKKIVENTRHTLAIEAMAAAQALDLLTPLKTSRRLQKAHAAIRAVSSALDRDRAMYLDFARISDVIANGKIADALR